MADKLWFVIVAIGPVLLGLVIAFGLMRRRRIGTVEKARQEEAVERLYDKPEGGREPSYRQN
ncbi:hypothetical protein [Pseudorhizobium flavum]|uniref:Uncharacterized protein n=1 Tax=Pseudorhizobium flavum TaxID=1335061 RepID=A0A7W9YY83_9HYPH|nr:hypothetical protein [Pseudorhizobium flavum]MBB6180594.1 hypothetical protein [Pseudorhizobium flavum]CAD6615899.1 hypothetical protein RFYW14_02996 [Pseudorhizobium flavum]